MEITKSNIISKILAGENVDLIVNDTIDTASFDLLNRIVRVPEKMFGDEDFSMAIIGHEISHCLHTPPSEYMEFVENHKNEINADKIPYASSVLNIVEDVRIDKLIQRKYPGIKKYYKLSVEYLKNQDFFELKNKNVNDLCFVDRLAIFSKVDERQSFFSYDVQFSDEEWKYVEKCKAAETFDEVEALTVEILNRFDLDKKTKNLDDSEVEQKNSKGNAEKVDSANNGEAAGKKKKFVPGLGERQLLSDLWNQKIESQSDISYDPQGAMKKIQDVVPAKEKFAPNNNVMSSVLNSIISSYKGFNNHFIRDFLKKKRAHELSKMQYANTGILDSNNLYKYKFAEDIFQKKEIEVRQKNHGFIFLIDCSSSMSNIFKSLTEQICSFYDILKKLDIPFEFYGFTTQEYGRLTKKVETNFGASCLLYDFFDDKTKKIDVYGILDKILQGQIYLGGTPLSEALTQSFDVIKNFQNKHNVDILNFIVITDGGDGIFCDSKYVSYKGGVYKVSYSSRGTTNYTSAVFRIMRDFFGVNVLHFDITDHVPTTMLNNIDVQHFFSDGFLHVENFGGANDVFYVKESLIKNRSNSIVKTLTDILA